jgi:hypothetical protein
MNEKWRFRVVRIDHSARFIRRPDSIGPLVGTIADALQFARRVEDYFRDTVSLVEAWGHGYTDEPPEENRQTFFINRHPNKRNWLLEKSRLTHPACFHSLYHAVNYAAFRGRGYSWQILVRDGLLLTIIAANATGSIAAITPPGGRDIIKAI